MKRHASWKKTTMAAVVAVSLVFSLSPGFALAADSGAANPNSDVPEWAVDTGASTTAKKAPMKAPAPSKYDLRDEGLVTPVKFQNPWGSCWAFGGTAAAETSILSSLGTTYADSKLDLSERFLTYFALRPITANEDASQVGEGLHVLNTAPNSEFEAGGRNILITTLFASGVGPVVEELYPYRGRNARTTYDDFIQAINADVGVQTYEDLMSHALKNGIFGQTFDDEQAVKDWLWEQFDASNLMTYSENDDWSIPDTNESGMSNRLLSNGFVLKDGNILPNYWVKDADGKRVELNDAGTKAIKQELLNGHGVSISYWADQSGQYTVSDDVHGREYAQYVYEPQAIDHGACVVGWDDSYAKENFSHDVYKLKDPSAPYEQANYLTDGEGNPIVDDDATAKATPPADGAWIVKNSWGSETDAGPDDLGNTVNKLRYGVKNENGESTGYFYLSYYDQSIDSMETMDFSTNLAWNQTFAAMQYDYMPATAGFYKVNGGNDVTSSANVFTADDDIELKSVSTRTPEANMRTTFAIYRLSDDAGTGTATDPAKGELVYRVSKNFEYAGFHRLDLDKPIVFEKGARFSVVSTTSTLNDEGVREYSVSASQGLAKDLAAEMNQRSYSAAVVNAGESFLYQGGGWTDWGNYLSDQIIMYPGTDIPIVDPETGNTLPYTEAYPVDNFSIKVYAVPAPEDLTGELEEAQQALQEATAAAEQLAQANAKDKAAAEKELKAANAKLATTEKKLKDAEANAGVEANPMEAKAKTVKAKATKKTTFKKTKAFSVKKAKGKVSFYKISGNAKVTVSKSGKVTVKKGLKKNKTYKVKVLVTAAGNKGYAPAFKTVTLKVKVK